MSRPDPASASATEVPSPALRAFPVVAGCLFAWLCLWIWLSWPYSLDDALIHLRYADHLLHQHRITYDGVHESFGTSSLLYVSLLAALRLLWTSPLLPRVVSSLAYALLFSALATTLYRSLSRAGKPPQVLWLIGIALLAVMVQPSAARWLNDGMETGLVFLDALGAVFLLRQMLRREHPTPPFLAAAFLYGLLTVLLRIELLLLVGCVSLMAALETALSPPSPERLAPRAGNGLLVAVLPLTGGLTAVCLVFLTLHALLPDTALAKAFGSSAWDQTFRMTAVTVASSFSFGAGLLLLWVGSFVALLVFDRVRAADLCANALFPAVLLLSASRGQQIQGIRYFGWTLFFPLLWNLLRTAESPRRGSRSADLALSLLAALVLAALIPAAVWESRTFYRLFQGRGSALNAFRAESLHGLEGKLGIAEDVGFIGYFTQGNICDPYGLVNGRAAARLKYQQRFDHCMAMHPVFAFGSQEFLHRVQGEQSLAGWSVCGTYRFDNVRTRDVHFLAVAPGEAAQACPGRAQPLAAVLPHL